MAKGKNISNCDHLDEDVKAALLFSDEERIYRIRSPRWIGYKRAQEILKKLENLLIHPKMHRMPNLLISGQTNNGKTMIINHFYRDHPASDNPEGDAIKVPVLIVRVPPDPDEGRLYDEILKKIHAPFNANDRPAKKLLQVHTILGKIGMKMLIIDEIHDILAGTKTHQRQFLNTIKYLCNELQISIVAVGTADASNALRSDPQLANRFDRELLPKWQNNDEYLRLLDSFECRLPLWKPSNLIQTELALKLRSMSEGIIGELAAVLTMACIEAVRRGHEQITLQTLNSIGWTQPSDR